MKELKASKGKWLFDGTTYTKEIFAPDDKDLSAWQEVERTDLIFDEEAYTSKVEELIRTRYSVADELAILRQRDSKPQEWESYYQFAEECKAQAKEMAWIEPEPEMPELEVPQE